MRDEKLFYFDGHGFNFFLSTLMERDKNITAILTCDCRIGLLYN